MKLEGVQLTTRVSTSVHKTMCVHATIVMVTQTLINVFKLHCTIIYERPIIIYKIWYVFPNLHYTVSACNLEQSSSKNDPSSSLQWLYRLHRTNLINRLIIIQLKLLIPLHLSPDRQISLATMRSPWKPFGK